MADLKENWRPGERYTADAANAAAHKINAVNRKFAAIPDEGFDLTPIGVELVTAVSTAAAREAVDADTYVAYDTHRDGVSDDRAILAAADAAAWAAKKPLLLPAGTYRVNSDLSFVSAVIFQPGAKIKPASGVTVSFPGGVVTFAPYQIFDHSLGGKCVPLKVHYYHPGWWGPTNTADDSQTWEDMLLAAQAYSVWQPGQQRILVPQGDNRLFEITLSNVHLEGLGRSSWIKAPAAAVAGDPEGSDTGYIVKLTGTTTTDGIDFEANVAGITAIFVTGSKVHLVNGRVLMRGANTIGIWTYDTGSTPKLTNFDIEGVVGSDAVTSGEGLRAESTDGQCVNVHVHDVGLGVNMLRASWVFVATHVYQNGQGFAGVGYDHRFIGCQIADNRGWGIDFEQGSVHCTWDSGTKIWRNGLSVPSTGGMILRGPGSTGCQDNHVDARFDDNTGTNLYLQSADRTTGEPMITSTVIAQGASTAVATDGIYIDADCVGTELHVLTPATAPAPVTNLIVNNQNPAQSYITFRHLRQTITTSGGTTTLTASSRNTQECVGPSDEIVKLPSVTSIGLPWTIINNSSGTIAVHSSADDAIWSVPSGRTGIFFPKTATPTSSSNWNVFVSGSSSATAYTAVLRDSAGAVTVSTPTASGHAATKSYVDSTRQPKFMTGTVATAAATTAKTVTLDAPWDSTTPATGDFLLLKFTNGSTASNPTLAVNNGTAYQIATPGGGTNGSNVGAAAGYSILMEFDSSASRYLTVGATFNTTYAEIAAVDITNSTGTNTGLISGQRAEALMANEATKTRTLSGKTLTDAKITGYATGSRPSASTAGATTMIYDTTLNKPVWSDGTNWRDAAGTIV